MALFEVDPCREYYRVLEEILGDVSGPVRAHLDQGLAVQRAQQHPLVADQVQDLDVPEPIPEEPGPPAGPVRVHEHNPDVHAYRSKSTTPATGLNASPPCLSRLAPSPSPISAYCSDSATCECMFLSGTSRNRSSPLTCRRL